MHPIGNVDVVLKFGNWQILNSFLGHTRIQRLWNYRVRFLKKLSTVRVCIHYTVIDAHTRPISYPLPKIDELADIIREGTKYFSCLDRIEAYHSLPIEPNSRKYAAIIAHYWVFIPHSTLFRFFPMAFQERCKAYQRIALNISLFTWTISYIQ